MKFLPMLTALVCAVSLTAQIAYTDNVWQHDRFVFAADNSKVIPEPTAFRIRSTESSLEIDVKLEGTHWKKLQEKTFKPAPSKWPMEESVEIFLDPGRSCSKFIQLAAGVDGNLFDSRLVKKPWTAKWTAVREDFNGGVVLKFVIPFDDGMKKPSPGEVWGFNLCRNVKNAVPYFSTFAKVGRIFKTPSRFAELRFGNEKTFAAANQAKNLKQLAVVEKEISAAGLSSRFAPQIARLRKNCNETDVQALKDEFRLVKAMKEIK